MSNNILHPISLNSSRIGRAKVADYGHNIRQQSGKENNKRPTVNRELGGYHPPTTRWRNDFFVQFVQ